MMAIELGEIVGPPVLDVVEGQMTPEPAGTPGPASVSPDKPKPDHPASEPGVPEVGDALEPSPEVTEKPSKEGNGDQFVVTPDGVVLPKGEKHRIPGDYVQNPHRPGSYGKIVDGKFKELIRIDPSTLPGQKGPNTSHYHIDGKGKHYSPAPGDKDPGFPK